MGIIYERNLRIYGNPVGGNKTRGYIFSVKGDEIPMELDRIEVIVNENIPFYEGDLFTVENIDIKAIFNDDSFLFLDKKHLTFSIESDEVLQLGEYSIDVILNFGEKVYNTNYNITVLKKPAIFGIQLFDVNNKRSLSRLTKENDPNELVTVELPATVTSKFFDDFSPWSGMVEYNIINDELINKEDPRFSYSNDTVVKIPEFYIKIETNSLDNVQKIYLSDCPNDGFIKHPGSNRYVGKYACDANGNIKTGMTKDTSSSIVKGRKIANQKGEQWSAMDYKTWQALQIISLFEYLDKAMLNSTPYIDDGFNPITGSTDSMGKTAEITSRKNRETKYRNIESLTGNLNILIEGLNINPTTGEIFIANTSLHNYSSTILESENYSRYGDILLYKNVNTDRRTSTYISSFRSYYGWDFYPYSSVEYTAGWVRSSYYQSWRSSTNEDKNSPYCITIANGQFNTNIGINNLFNIYICNQHNQEKFNPFGGYNGTQTRLVYHGGEDNV